MSPSWSCENHYDLRAEGRNKRCDRALHSDGSLWDLQCIHIIRALLLWSN